MNDHITRYATTDHLAIAVVRCTDTVATIAAQHELTGEPQQILGEAITAALLMGTRLKGPGVLNFSLRCENTFSHMRVDAIGMGSVRAMVTESVREQLQQWNGVDALLGPGEVEVSKQLAKKANPTSRASPSTTSSPPGPPTATLPPANRSMPACWPTCA